MVVIKLVFVLALIVVILKGLETFCELLIILFVVGLTILTNWILFVLILDTLLRRLVVLDAFGVDDSVKTFVFEFEKMGPCGLEIKLFVLLIVLKIIFLETGDEIELLEFIDATVFRGSLTFSLVPLATNKGVFCWCVLLASKDWLEFRADAMNVEVLGVIGLLVIMFSELLTFRLDPVTEAVGTSSFNVTNFAADVV